MVSNRCDGCGNYFYGKELLSFDAADGRNLHLCEACKSHQARAESELIEDSPAKKAGRAVKEFQALDLAGPEKNTLSDKVQMLDRQIQDVGNAVLEMKKQIKKLFAMKGAQP